MAPEIAYILYGLFALGGVGLYLAMPRGEESRLSHKTAGALLGLGAVVGLLVLLATLKRAPEDYAAVFYIFAAIAILAAGRVVTHSVPTYSVVYFGVVVLSVAVLLVIQFAEFLAVALVIIYAGAILVTYAFVIMLAQQSGAPRATDLKARRPLMAILVSFVAMGALAGTIGELPRGAESPKAAARHGDVHLAADGGDRASEPQGERTAEGSSTGEASGLKAGNTREVGWQMFGGFVIAVELAGLLLLVAMVGAIAIARKRVPVEEIGPPPPPLGQIGREVPPF